MSMSIVVVVVVVGASCTTMLTFFLLAAGNASSDVCALRARALAGDDLNHLVDLLVLASETLKPGSCSLEFTLSTVTSSVGHGACPGIQRHLLLRTLNLLL